MTRYDRKHLIYLYWRESWRRVRRRLALAHFALTRATVKIPERLVVAPTDLRIIDPFVAEEIIADRFPLAGRMMATEGESPFLLPPPSPAFEARLHAFAWLRHIRADKSDEACLKARRLVDQKPCQDGNHAQPDDIADVQIAKVGAAKIVVQIGGSAAKDRH